MAFNPTHEKYLESVVPTLTEEFSYPNNMDVPRISKVVLNIGLGEANQDRFRTM